MPVLPPGECVSPPPRTHAPRYLSSIPTNSSKHLPSTTGDIFDELTNINDDPNLYDDATIARTHKAAYRDLTHPRCFFMTRNGVAVPFDQLEIQAQCNLLTLCTRGTQLEDVCEHGWPLGWAEYFGCSVMTGRCARDAGQSINRLIYGADLEVAGPAVTPHLESTRTNMTGAWCMGLRASKTAANGQSVPARAHVSKLGSNVRVGHAPYEGLQRIGGRSADPQALVVYKRRMPFIERMRHSSKYRAWKKEMLREFWENREAKENERRALPSKTCGPRTIMPN